MLDYGSEEPLYHNVASLHVPPNDDQNIHVHKERTTGGGFCAKFVFFILLSALAVLIGLIITEHRGLTDRKYLLLSLVYNTNLLLSLLLLPLRLISTRSFNF